MKLAQLSWFWLLSGWFCADPVFVANRAVMSPQLSCLDATSHSWATCSSLWTRRPISSSTVCAVVTSVRSSVVASAASTARAVGVVVAGGKRPVAAVARLPPGNDCSVPLAVSPWPWWSRPVLTCPLPPPLYPTSVTFTGEPRLCLELAALTITALNQPFRVPIASGRRSDRTSTAWGDWTSDMTDLRRINFTFTFSRTNVELLALAWQRLPVPIVTQTCRPTCVTVSPRDGPAFSWGWKALTSELTPPSAETAKAKTKTYNIYTCIAPQAAYRSCSVAFVSQRERAYSI